MHLPAARVLCFLFLTSRAVSGPVTGAIFTTNPDGSKVNANIYGSKEDVYLNGGPSVNGDCGPAGLPAGDYYFQVTDPSGHTLLSTDPITSRKITVGAAGVFASADNHDTNPGNCGGVLVQLMPYLDTPNNGGEYKVWVTPVDDYSAGSGKNGFLPSKSKTDNFKVRESSPPATTGSLPGCLELFKIYDTNTNGQRDAGEPILDSWRFTVRNVDTGVTTTYTTPLTVYLPLGTYEVCDTRPQEPYYLPTVDLCGTVTLTDSECVDAMRACICLGPGGARPASFWASASGQALMTSGDFSALDALFLRDATGNADFTPTSAAQVASWMAGATTAVPRYYLSVQLAVSTLNTRHGVDPVSMILGRGVAVQSGFDSGYFSVASAQMTANTALWIPLGDETALAIASVLADSNDNLIFLQDTPCPYSFAPARR